MRKLSTSKKKRFQAYVDRTYHHPKGILHSTAKRIFYKCLCCVRADLVFSSTSFICFFMPKCWQAGPFKIETFTPTFPRFYLYRRLIGLYTYCSNCLGILSSAKLSKSGTDFFSVLLFRGCTWSLWCSLIQP
jgi:hypothetical protein